MSTAHNQEGRSPGFKRYRVVAKRPENRLITSLMLSPLDQADWRTFEPGQFLVFKVPGPAGRPVPKQYSVSSSPRMKDAYRITVKREAAPAPGLPDGVGSCFLHDKVEVGSVLEAQGPRGDFTLDRSSNRPVVLLSGGVGLTPMLAMLDVLVHETARRVTYIHGCLDGSLHAMRDEVAALAAVRPGVTVRTVYQQPTQADREARRFDAEGFITRERLQAWLPLDDYDFYLCGPPGFMKAVYGALRSLGVAKERIAYEFFGPATVLDEDVRQPAASAGPVALPVIHTDQPSVTLRKSGRVAAWSSGTASLLDFVEAQGLSPEFSCRAGVCGTCKADLVSGTVRYVEEPLDPPGAGHVLLCCSQPVGPVVLDL